MALISCGVPTRSAEGQEAVCPGGVVRRIDIVNNSLFAPRDIEGRRFGWALSFTNVVHIRTRQGFLRNELLLSEGECFDPHRLSESERLIRDLDFIARVETRAEEVPDSGWVVHVETWDEWTTQAVVDFNVESEAQFRGFFVNEKNLLGRGLRLNFLYRDFRERDDRSLTLSTGRFMGSRVGAAVSAGKTRTGHMVGGGATHPFVSEMGRFSLDARLSRSDVEYAYLTGDDNGVSHLLLPMRDTRGWVRVSRRWGSPGALTMLGGEVDMVRRPVVAAPRMVVRHDFGGAVTAHDSLAARLAPQDSPDSHLRLGVTAGIRRLRFTTAQGVDRITGVQNVSLGTELTTVLGRTVTAFGTDTNDTYARLDAFYGVDLGGLTTTSKLRGEARLVDMASPGSSPWRDLGLSGDFQAYVQPSGSPLQVFIAGLRLRARANVDQPFQSTLGGESGVRSYRDDEMPVGSSVVAFAEHRLNLALFKPTVDLGLTVFGDVGRGWASDVPFAVDTGWRSAVGVGIRIGAPAGTGSISHIELAWPVGGPDPNRGPLLRTYWSPITTSR